jgi:BirA family transcriptional regulator, biotin operon repressor / biotin---[acetyl-CoA-carboxylase] ligase
VAVVTSMSHLERQPEFDLPRLSRHPLLAEMTYLEEAESSNDLALARGQDRNLVTPHLILVRRQTGGRGRGANRWWATDGALTFSLVLDGPHIPLPMAQWPRLSLIAGLAVATALEQYVPADALQLKWPNDIYYRQRKLAGVLVETTHGPATRCVIGIGVNVNNSLSQAPAEIVSRAAALIDSVGRLSLSEILEAILWQFQQHLLTLRQEPEAWLDAWRPRCLLTGRQVEITAGAESQRGYCGGVDAEGALLVQAESGLRRCFSGVVTRFE